MNHLYGAESAGRSSPVRGVERAGTRAPTFTRFNVQVAALKKSFYAGAPGNAEAGATGSQPWSVLGVLEDMPLCRWEMVMLPGSLRISGNRCTLRRMPRCAAACRASAVIQLAPKHGDKFSANTAGFNQVLNVFQPMYTHMFEAVLARSTPSYYVHLQTPGGTANLMNPEYDLRTGSKAPLVGVLMR